MSNNNSKGKTNKKGRSGKREKRSHFHRHRKPIMLITGKSACKTYQYSGGWFGYKGRKRIFIILTFNNGKYFRK